MGLIGRFIVGFLTLVLGFFSLPAWAADEPQGQGVPSLSEKLELDESELKPMPAAELNQPGIDPSFLDLSSEPGAPVTFPNDFRGLGESPLDLE